MQCPSKASTLRNEPFGSGRRCYCNKGGAMEHEAYVTICQSANPNYPSKLSIVSGLVSDLLTVFIIIYKHSKYMTKTKEKHSNKLDAR